jgi:hypothetical protein
MKGQATTRATADPYWMTTKDKQRQRLNAGVLHSVQDDRKKVMTEKSDGERTTATANATADPYGMTTRGRTAARAMTTTKISGSLSR